MLEAGVDIRHAPRRTNARVHHVLQEVSGLSRSIERAFYEETGMRMMALQSLKNLLMDEPAIINMRR